MSDDPATWPTVETAKDITLPRDGVVIRCATDGGDITVTVPPEGEHWSFTIKSRGPGNVWLRRRVATKTER